MQVRDTELDEAQTASTDRISEAEEHLDHKQLCIVATRLSAVMCSLLPVYGTPAFHNSNSTTAGVSSSAGYIAAELAQRPLFPTSKTPA